MQLPLLHYASINTRYVVTLYSNLPPLTNIKRVLKFGTCETTFLLPRVYSTCVCTVQSASNVPPPFQIKRVRKATREEKKRRAMAMSFILMQLPCVSVLKGLKSEYPIILRMRKQSVAGLIV